MFSRALYRLHVSPRVVSVACFPALVIGCMFSALVIGCMFSHAWRRLRVVPPLASIACFPLLASVAYFPELGVGYMFFPLLALPVGCMFPALGVGSDHIKFSLCTCQPEQQRFISDANVKIAQPVWDTNSLLKERRKKCSCLFTLLLGLVACTTERPVFRLKLLSPELVCCPERRKAARVCCKMSICLQKIIMVSTSVRVDFSLCRAPILNTISYFILVLFNIGVLYVCWSPNANWWPK